MRKSIFFSIRTILTLCFLLSFTGCGQIGKQALFKSNETTETSEVINLFQLQQPIEGDKIAIVETEIGAIKFKLFTDLSPQCVKIFNNYVDLDYYLGASFDRAEPGLINQIDYHATFPDEIDEAEKMFYPYEDVLELKHIKGAVSLIYQFGEYTSPSLVFVMGSEVSQEDLDIMAYLGEESYSKDMIATYRPIGGMPSFDGRFTVIGQVYEGYEVLEAINQLPVEEAADNMSHHLLKDPLKIKIIEIKMYE